MDLGHGFVPRIDARNYKAFERCLTRDASNLFNQGIDVPWALLEGPWALAHGSSTLELCRDRSIAVLIDTQAWRYRDPRTFTVEKFTSVDYAPSAPLSERDSAEVKAFVAADLQAQASLGASAYLLPGFVPSGPRDDVTAATSLVLEIAQDLVLFDPRPAVAFVGVHTSALDSAFALIDRLPHWLEGVYVQFTPVNPMNDSPAKIIDCLALLHHAGQRGLSVIGGRLAGHGLLARAIGVDAVDSGLGEGESFGYSSKIRNHHSRRTNGSQPRVLSGRLYSSQLHRSVSSAEWRRLMEVPAIQGQLLCRLPCCAFGQPLENAPSRGREHSLHARVAEAKAAPKGWGITGLEDVVRLMEQRQSTLRLVSHSLVEAGLDPIGTTFIENHVAAARFFRDAASEVA